MKESRKKLNTTSKMLAGLSKTVMLVIIVVCFTLAVVIFIKTQSGGTGGIESIKRGEELYWVKCNNPKCGAEYQMDKKDYYEQIEEKMRANPMAMVTPPLTCKECGKPSLLRAVKCEKCGHVFFYGADPTDFADRCPKCSYCKTEKLRELHRQAQELVYSTEGKLKEYARKVSADTRRKIESAIDNLKEAEKGQDTKRIEKALEDLRAASQELDKAL